jgi:myo-inositol-1(or 4)-monophosphatase
MESREHDLELISSALARAVEAFRPFTPGEVAFEHKVPGDPVTAADRAVNEVLRETLVAPGEGWLSEETADDLSRLEAGRVWVVDPLDGTREFVQGIPEWCASVALVEDGEPVAAGVANPATGETFLGGPGLGLTLNGRFVRVSGRSALEGALVLASRSEVSRGEWARFADRPFLVQPMGSVAYKLARVAAGLADATWTLVPKNEWDVAAGVALIRAAGGEARTLEGAPPQFNRPETLLSGLVAASTTLLPAILTALAIPSAAGGTR